MKVELNRHEVMLAEYLGRLRYEENRKKGIQDNQVSKLDKVEMDQNGVGAEIAFAKWANLYPDMGENPGKWDVLTHSAYFVDAKNTMWPNGRLLITFKSGSYADLYVLVTGSLPIYYVAGWSTGVVIRQQTEDLGFGPTYALKQTAEKFRKDVAEIL